MPDLEEKLFLAACKAPTHSLTLCDRGLRYVPDVVGKLSALRQLNVKKNRIKSIAKELSDLKHVRIRFAFCSTDWSVHFQKLSKMSQYA